jgi:hypothetical protein
MANFRFFRGTTTFSRAGSLLRTGGLLTNPSPRAIQTMKTSPIFMLGLWALRCSFVLISVGEATTQVIIPFIPNSPRTSRHVAAANPTARSAATRTADHSGRIAADGTSHPKDRTDASSKPAFPPPLRVPRYEEPTPETPIAQELRPLNRTVWRNLFGSSVSDIMRPLEHPPSVLLPHPRHRQDQLFCSSQYAAPGPPERHH